MMSVCMIVPSCIVTPIGRLFMRATYKYSRNRLRIMVDKPRLIILSGMLMMPNIDLSSLCVIRNTAHKISSNIGYGILLTVLMENHNSGISVCMRCNPMPYSNTLKRKCNRCFMSNLLLIRILRL